MMVMPLHELRWQTLWGAFTLSLYIGYSSQEPPGSRVKALDNSMKTRPSTVPVPPPSFIAKRAAPSQGETSGCLRHFGWNDFDCTRLNKKPTQCPLHGC